MKKLIFSALAAALFLGSCSSDDDENNNTQMQAATGEITGDITTIKHTP